MKIEILQSTPLEVLVKAIRTCWDSHNRSDDLGDKDLDLIDRVCNKAKHESTMEHIVFTFNIEGISRLCLQELARHRMASLSVKSTRYTLKELKKEKDFMVFYDFDENWESVLERASKYVVLSNDDDMNEVILYHLDDLKEQLFSMSIDEAKYILPECYKTNLVWTINARSLKNFLSLRMSKQAHFEIRELATKIYNMMMGSEYSILFKDLVEDT